MNEKVTRSSFWILVSLIYGICLAGISYFIRRDQFILLCILFGICFFLYLYIIRRSKDVGLTFFHGVTLAIGLRLVLIAAIPNLSDDFYRYLFDGHLILNGINPYADLPEESLQLIVPESDYLNQLMIGMNSRNYFSIYPPLHQLFFFVAACLGENLIQNIIGLRVILIALELVNFYLISRILSMLEMPKYYLWWYAFNPLVILELVGNLHFEGLVLTGILGSIFFFHQFKNSMAAISWTGGIALKLTPLILGPVWLFSLPKEKLRTFFLVSIISLFLLLSPLIFSGHPENFWSSFRLYQSKFEFNASVYYLIRWISGFFVDYNPQVYVGPVLGGLTFLIIILYAWFAKVKSTVGIIHVMLHVYIIYLLLQTTFHPWYLIPAFGLGILIGSKFMIAWSGLIFLSYHAYQFDPVKEIGWVLILEYGLLFCFWICWKGNTSKGYE